MSVGRVAAALLSGSVFLGQARKMNSRVSAKALLFKATHTRATPPQPSPASRKCNKANKINWTSGSRRLVLPHARIPHAQGAIRHPCRAMGRAARRSQSIHRTCVSPRPRTARMPASELGLDALASGVVGWRNAASGCAWLSQRQLARRVRVRSSVGGCSRACGARLLSEVAVRDPLHTSDRAAFACARCAHAGGDVRA